MLVLRAGFEPALRLPDFLGSLISMLIVQTYLCYRWFLALSFGVRDSTLAVDVCGGVIS
jgi:hypothetical protein